MLCPPTNRESALQRLDNPKALSHGAPPPRLEDPNNPSGVLGFRDLVLFYVITGISLRWIATAARPGQVPSSSGLARGSLSICRSRSASWNCRHAIPTKAAFMCGRKRAFGDFSGFMSAWTYWTCNLPYFPAVLYFAASNALYMRQSLGPSSRNTSSSLCFRCWCWRWPRCSTFLGSMWALGCTTWERWPCGFRSASSS